MDIGLNTAYTGLLAAKNGLYTVSHNIDNTKMPGYSRQKISQRATMAHFIYKDGFLGTGTDVYNIERIRDEYLDFKFRNESAYRDEWDVKHKNLDEIQKTLGEPSDSSFRKYLEDFYNSINRLSTNPGDMSYRQPVIENAVAMSKHFNETYAKLELHHQDILKEAQNTVDKINQLGRDIATLNKQISMLEIDGKTANDLRDTRDLKIDELSQYAFITVAEVDAISPEDLPIDKRYDRKTLKQLNVSIGGISLVDHEYVNEMSLKETDEDPVVPWANPDKKIKDGHTAYKVVWENSGDVLLTGGRLKGLMDMYNGNGEHNSFRGIRFYKNKLNEFAFNFTEKFNIIHRRGYTLDTANNPGETNINFFKPSYQEKYDAIKKKIDNGDPVTPEENAFFNDVTRYKELTQKLQDGNLTATEKTEKKQLIEEKEKAKAESTPFDATKQERLYELEKKEQQSPLTTAQKEEMQKLSAGLKNNAASLMAVEQDVSENPYKIAAAGGDIGDLDAENNINLLAMLGNSFGGREDNQFFDDANGVSQGMPEDFIKSVISIVGVDKQQAERFYHTEELLTTNLSQRRLSVSGVELNEEMGDMVQFQHVYAAAARMISTMDEILDITVNRLGMAGR